MLLRTFIGGGWFDSQPEYEIVKLLPRLLTMKETLEEVKTALSKDKSRKDKLDLLQTLGRSDFNDGMFLVSSVVNTNSPPQTRLMTRSTIPLKSLQNILVLW